jgi:hypothetical protein
VTIKVQIGKSYKDQHSRTWVCFDQHTHKFPDGELDHTFSCILIRTSSGEHPAKNNKQFTGFKTTAFTQNGEFFAPAFVQRDGKETQLVEECPHPFKPENPSKDDPVLIPWTRHSATGLLRDLMSDVSENLNYASWLNGWEETGPPIIRRVHQTREDIPHDPDNPAGYSALSVATADRIMALVNTLGHWVDFDYEPYHPKSLEEHEEPSS